MYGNYVLTPSKNLLKQIPESKLDESQREPNSGAWPTPNVNERIERPEERHEGTILIITRHSRQREQDLWTKPEKERFGKVKDFELTNIYGKKLDSKWVESQLLVEVTPSSVAGFRLDAGPCTMERLWSRLGPLVQLEESGECSGI